MQTGTEWLIDALGCHPKALADLEDVRRACELVIGSLELHVIGAPLWHQFPTPAGVTGMYLLSESHLTCHTFPEWKLATFNLYCCRPRVRFDWEGALTSLLGAAQVVVRCLPRGLLPAAPASSVAGSTQFPGRVQGCFGAGAVERVSSADDGQLPVAFAKGCE
jgi:S-adenosylmethionine decarboxylase